MTRSLKIGFGLLIASLPLAGCAIGPSATGSFDRTITVSAPVRLELANASGDVVITGTADGKMHIHGDARSSGWGFDEPQKRLNQVISSPPIEQAGNTIRVGKSFSHTSNVGISYVIEVPRDTEISTTVGSGSQTIKDVRGPVKVSAASGSIRVMNVERETQLTTLSGSIDVDTIGDDLRASSASGTVSVFNIKGDVKISALSGATRIAKAGGRIDADTASGSVEVAGATRDVKAHAMSGRIDVQGDPGATSYWDLRTVSGEVQLGVPTSANFHLSAEAVSGQIKTDVPVVVEEQGKHNLRARMGNGGGRVEVHTVSGEIKVRGT
jgi:DUF4097 and DUF4098 domain-containing protein YvlB